jgi:hypothetical protein
VLLWEMVESMSRGQNSIGRIITVKWIEAFDDLLSICDIKVIIIYLFFEGL